MGDTPEQELLSRLPRQEGMDPLPIFPYFLALD